MNMSTEIVATWVGVISLGLVYLKDKSTASRDYGKLEQKVEFLESEIRKVDSLRQEVHNTNLSLARLEEKLDSILEKISRH